MNYAYEIRRQAEAAPRAALPAVASALWKAFGEGHVSEVEAEALSGLIEARKLPERPKDLSQCPNEASRSRIGSRPRTDASMARRRRWAASGRLPPGLAARFTLAEQAVLAVVCRSARWGQRNVGPTRLTRSSDAWPRHHRRTTPVSVQKRHQPSCDHRSSMDRVVEIGPEGHRPRGWVPNPARHEYSCFSPCEFRGSERPRKPPKSRE
jgi:hypothetical protein